MWHSGLELEPLDQKVSGSGCALGILFPGRRSVDFCHQFLIIDVIIIILKAKESKEKLLVDPEFTFVYHCKVLYTQSLSDYLG